MAQPSDLTRNQALVLGALNAAEAPLSAYDLLDRLRIEGLRAPLQIYRALEKLTEKGLAHRLESLNAFVACAEPHHHHRAGLVGFAICEGCGTVSEFADEVLKARLGEIEARDGFVARLTTIEIRGHCRACAAAA